MPLFNYKCRECSHEFERLLLNPTDRDLPQICPACGKKEGERRTGSRFASRSQAGGGAPECGPFR